MRDPFSLSWKTVPVLGLCSLAAGCACCTSSKETTGTASAASPAPGGAGQVSDPKLVAKYDALASEIIDTRQKEVEMVRTLLEQTYRDAEAALARARTALRS